MPPCAPGDAEEVLRPRRVVIAPMPLSDVEALPAWFRERGARRVRPTASARAEPSCVARGSGPEPDPLPEPAL
ncbi:hypothetical protein [Streptomyces sp. NPDC000931]|uniref:hypothetical protein n=1 Tax=Streptomyces sp. NPDC000931 TaxID=3154372 RepID=UPI00331C8392